MPPARLGVLYAIYYKAEPRQAGALEQAVAAMQAELAALTGVRGRCMRRADGSPTWMEWYPEVADCAGFESCLEALVARHELTRWLAPGERRHIEKFRPCA